QAIDAAVLLVAQVCLVGVALAGPESWRCRVVLHDEVVPIDHPDVAVRTNLGHDRSDPLIIAGYEVPPVTSAEISADRLQLKCRRQVPRRLGDKSGAVPVLSRVSAGGVQGMARSRGEAAVEVHLPDLVRDGIETVLQSDALQHARGPTANRFV